MKFLLEFVTCCTPCRRSSSKTSSLPPGTDDTRSLVPTVPPSIPPENRHYRSSKRWRTAASKSGSAADWRPSLNAISEDKAVVVERGNRAAAAGSERILKRKVSPTPRSHVRNRRSDDYVRAPIQAIMPAFSPTPFMF